MEVRSKTSRNSFSERIMEMPRPPPPEVALIMTGNPMVLAIFKPSSRFSTIPSDPWMIGTPAFFAIALAEALSPIWRIALAEGPTNFKPQLATISANCSFSDKNPYPG